MKKYAKKLPLNSHCVKVVNPLEKVKKQVRDYRHLDGDWKQKMLALSTEERQNLMLLYATQGNRNLVKLLCESSQDFDINCTYSGDNAVTLASRNGDFATVKYLVNHGIDINYIGANGKSCLHTYAKKGMVKECQFLLDNFAAVDIEDLFLQTPIFEATIFNKPEVIQLLASYNANLNAKNDNGQTPLMIACQNADRQESLLTLLNLGASIEAQDSKKQRALSYAIKANNRQFIDILLKRKCEINYKNANGTTPLMLAAKYGQKETIRVLLAKGADFMAKDCRGKTAVDYAIANGYKGSVQILQKAQRLYEQGQYDMKFFGKQNRVPNSCVM